MKNNYPWERYLIKLGQRSVEYDYDIEMIYKHIDYFKKCWSDGLSEYKSLEWFYEHLQEVNIKKFSLPKTPSEIYDEQVKIAKENGFDCYLDYIKWKTVQPYKYAIVGKHDKQDCWHKKNKYKTIEAAEQALFDLNKNPSIHYYYDIPNGLNAYDRIKYIKENKDKWVKIFYSYKIVPYFVGHTNEMVLGDNLDVTIDRVIRSEYFIKFFLNDNDVFIDYNVEMDVYNGMSSDSKNNIKSSIKILLENAIETKRSNKIWD